MATTPCWNCRQPATHTLTREGSDALHSCDNCTRIDRPEAERLNWTITRLPAPGRRPVPDSSSRDYCAHHDAIYSDPRVTDLDISARYIGETSTDNGQTWTSIPMPEGWGSVCGGHVQCEVAGALTAGWDVVADGTTRTIREWHGALTRWTLTVLTPEETAAMEEMIRESRARAR